MSNTWAISDWRLPNAKELQSIVDYTRSSATHVTAAIDPAYFSTTTITNEAVESDFRFYWTSTTRETMKVGRSSVNIGFGRCLGLVNGVWRDVHGAVRQRSNSKEGHATDYPSCIQPCSIGAGCVMANL